MRRAIHGISRASARGDCGNRINKQSVYSTMYTTLQHRRGGEQSNPPGLSHFGCPSGYYRPSTLSPTLMTQFLSWNQP